MIKNKNPFIVSGKIPTELFCDRKEETACLLKFLQSEENVVLMSQRRMGKTKLVEYCSDVNSLDKQYILMYVDILHTTSFREFIQLLGGIVFDNVARRSVRMMKLFTATVKSLSGSFGYDPIQNTPTFDVRLGDITAPEFTLDEIFQCIEKAERRCIIVIDEFQQVTKYADNNVEALLRSHIQKVSNANFVFAGSQRRLMEEMFFSERRPFYMSARSIQLAPIPFSDYFQFASHHFKLADKDIDEAAVKLVYDTFLGVTLYLQRMMKDAYNLTSRADSCDVTTIRQIIDDYVLECEPRLREQLAFVTETQKELLYAISEEPESVKNITASSFIKHHRLKSSSAVQAASRKLLEYDLLTRNEGSYSIADPLIALWLRSKRF